MNKQITISADLKSKVEQAAKLSGMSISQFVHQSLERAIATNGLEDPLFSDDIVFADEGSTDIAAHHDDYLYGNALCSSNGV